MNQFAITTRFATADRTAEVLGISSKRMRELTKLVADLSSIQESKGKRRIAKTSSGSKQRKRGVRLTSETRRRRLSTMMKKRSVQRRKRA